MQNAGLTRIDLKNNAWNSIYCLVPFAAGFIVARTAHMLALRLLSKKRTTSIVHPEFSIWIKLGALVLGSAAALGVTSQLARLISPAFSIGGIAGYFNRRSLQILGISGAVLGITKRLRSK